MAFGVIFFCIFMLETTRLNMKLFETITQKVKKAIDTNSLNNNYTYLAYLRKSVKDGDFRRQEYNIQKFAKWKGIFIENYYLETCSGLVPAKDRKVFMEIFQYCYENDDVVIILDSTDRFSRKQKTATDILNLLKLTNAKLYFIKEDLLVFPQKGKNVEQLIENISIANYEVKMYVHRMSGGYNAYRASGGKVGRKVGYRKSEAEMKIQYVKEIELLNDDYSLRRVQALTGTSINTLRKIKKLFYKK